MSRRVNLPGADELFRSTTPTAVSPDSGTGSAAEREQLLDTLGELGKSTRPQSRAPRPRKKKARKGA